MKRFLIGLGVLLVLLVGTLLIAPSFVDLNRFKDRVAAEVSRATGRTVAIDGTLALELLPTPHVRITQVRIGNIDGAMAPDMAEAEALDASVALGPLLGGAFQITSVTLVAPVVTLERLADGRANWEFAGASGGGGDTAISFDRVAVDNGTLIYRDATSGRSFQADGIDLEATAGSLRGPFEVEGSARVGGAVLGFTARIGALDKDSVPVALELRPGEDERVAFRGFVAGAGEALEVSGTVEAGGPSLAGTMSLAGVGFGPGTVLDGPYTATASVTASAAAITLGDVVATLGEVRATGAFEFVPGAPARLDGVVAVNRIDLDALLAAAPATSPPAAGDAGPLVPPGLAGSLSLGIDAMTLRGEVVQQIRLDMAFEDGVVILQQGGALLPGGSDLALFGVAERREGKPSFDGRVEIASDNLRTLLAWAGVAADAVPADRLRGLSFASPIVASPDGITFDGLDLRLDTSRITGRVDARLGAAPAVTAALAIDKLNLDAYLPAPGGEGPTALPAGMTVDLTLEAERITVRGQSAGGVALAARLAEGHLTVSRFAARDLAGAQVAFEGALDPLAPRYDGTLHVAGDDVSGLAQVAGLDPAWRLADLGRVVLDASLKGDTAATALDAGVTSGPFDGRVRGTVDLAATVLDITYDATVRDAGRALGAFAIAAPAALTQVGAARLSGSYKGGATGGDGRLKAEGTFGAIDLAGRIDAAATPLAFDLTLTAEGASRAAALALLGAAFDGADGAYEASGTAKGSLASATLDAALRTAGASATAKGSVSGLDAAPAYDLAVLVDHPNLDGMLRALGRPSTGVPGPLRLDLRLAGNAAALRTETLDATFGPARLTGSLSAALDREIPFVEASLQAGDLVLDPFLGGEDGSDEGERWSTEPLDLAGLGRIDGHAVVEAASLTLGAVRLDGAVIEASLAGGVLTLDRLDGRVFDGGLSASGRLAAGELHGLDMTIRLAGVDARRALAATAGYRDLGGRLDVETRLDSLGASEADLVGNLAGDARVALQDGAIDGYDLTAINQQLMNLDNIIGFAALVGTSLQGGSTPIRRADGTFVVERGVARSTDLTALMDGAEAFGTATIDLPRWVIDADGEARLLGHSESPPLGVKLRGPLDAPKTTFDTGALEAFVARRAVGSAIQEFGDDQTKDLFGIITGQPPAEPPPDAGLDPADLAPPDDGLSDLGEVPAEPLPEVPAEALPEFPAEPLPQDTGELPEPALPEGGQELPAEQQLLNDLLQGVLEN